MQYETVREVIKRDVKSKKCDYLDVEINIGAGRMCFGIGKLEDKYAVHGTIQKEIMDCLMESKIHLYEYDESESYFLPKDSLGKSSKVRIDLYEKPDFYFI